MGASGLRAQRRSSPHLSGHTPNPTLPPSRGKGMRTLDWRDRLLPLAARGLAAVAHPPFGFIPGLLGYALLLWDIDRTQTKRSAFFRGWLAGSVYFAISVWSVAEAFYVDIRPAWMAPFAVGLLATGLALFWGAAAALYRAFAPKGVARV